jgi:hypothetical protein
LRRKQKELDAGHLFAMSTHLALALESVPFGLSVMKAMTLEDLLMRKPQVLESAV